MFLKVLVTAAAAVVALAAASASVGDEFILRAPESEAYKLAARQGLLVLDRVPQRDVFLVQGPDGVPPEEVIARVLADPEIDDEHDKISMEENIVVWLPEAGLAAPLYSSTTDAERALRTRRLVPYHGSQVWASHARQKATTRVRVADAHRAYGIGAAIVAVIDSGVDAAHPALASGVMEGFDFTRDLPGGSELADIDPEHPILNPTNVVILDNDTIVPINPFTQALLEPGQAAAIVPGTVPATFGHGTMVASLVRLVAPDATIMPLKAFDGNGAGRLYDVIRALYYAEVEGASVINLSLSMAVPSLALQEAVRVLHERQRFLVASAGNEGRETLRYPAAFPEPFGIAAVRPNDRRSRFSNFGNELVSLAAPGEALIAAYPAGQYALAWGTSFSTPLAAGTIALMLQVKPGINWDEVERSFSRADAVLDAGLGAGRLNVFCAVGEAAGVQC